jgi:hypothetical protein
MKHLRYWLAFISGLACSGHDARGGSPAERSTTGSTLASTGGTVDSAIPIEEALGRFREGVPRPVSLDGGFTSRERLVRSFVRALETRDTAALGKMALGMAEFAWFYYPSSPMSRRPYELAPSLMWFQLQGEINRGASLLLAERAGRPLGYLGHTCGQPRTEGDNRLYPYCGLRRVTETGDTVGERLFGLIIERDGKHKFVSYANRLD